MKKRDPKKGESIFSSTLHLVKQKGLVGITMADIAKDAGLATGTLYIYFSSKEDIFHALYKETKLSIANFLFFKEGEEKLSYKEQFFLITGRYIEYALKFYDASVFQNQYKRSHFYTSEDASISEQVLSPVLAFLDAGKKQKLLKDVETSFLLSFPLSVVQGYVDDIHFGARHDTPQYRQDLITFLWDSLSLHS